MKSDIYLGYKNRLESLEEKLLDFPEKHKSLLFGVLLKYACSLWPSLNLSQRSLLKAVCMSFYRFDYNATENFFKEAVLKATPYKPKCDVGSEIFEAISLMAEFIFEYHEANAYTFSEAVYFFFDEKDYSSVHAEAILQDLEDALRQL